MERAEPYDHDNRKGEYHEKNAYFSRANDIAMPFLEMGITGMTKLYYWEMLNAIGKYENDRKKPLNKGMACGNLGVSALAEGDLDGGIAYLLWAGHEDRAWSADPSKSAFANDLYRQFAEGTQREGRSQFGELSPWVMMKSAIGKYNTESKDNISISQLFSELNASPEHRALLEGSLWSFHRNVALLREETRRGIYSGENNIYTRLRLFDALTSLCRFIELRMRHYERIPGTLGKLLQTIFGKENWFKTEVDPRDKSPETSNGFDNLVKDVLQNCRLPAKNVLILWGLRNYATHICDPDTPFLFGNIEKVFEEIAATYPYYLRYRKKI